MLTNGLREKEEEEAEEQWQWGRECRRLLLLSYLSFLEDMARKKPFQAVRHHPEKEPATLLPREGHVIP